ncbi:MAG: hydroxyacid dehydrogenase [candidate division Zixibacteria bacterium]|jgi:D-3-phosphoglycerate dehydrogenase|nr:hydroxyacid dehydrogenase [candidate division Zixibacteria bacterium]
MLILISDAFDAELPKKLARYGDVTDDKGRMGEAEIVVVRSKTKVNREYIDLAKKMKLVIRGGVGLDNIDRIYAQEKGIMVRNTADASTTAVAELAFAMMISLACNVAPADSSMREGKWLKKELERTELHGKTLGILGLGRIGLALAYRAQAFRMRVLGWHPDVYFTDWAEICDSVEDVLRQSDYVSLHMPLLPDTRGMINKETLKQFRDGAYLVNTARGQICVEEDVAEALKSGKLAGFATDVWYSDPPEKSPLFDAPNTLFLPHIGASTKENMTRIGIIVERLIADYVENR